MQSEQDVPVYNDKFETRDWDRQYEKYIRKLGPAPGPHPDPDCIWNTDPNSYSKEAYEDARRLKI